MREQFIIYCHSIGAVLGSTAYGDDRNLTHGYGLWAIHKHIASSLWGIARVNVSCDRSANLKVLMTIWIYTPNKTSMGWGGARCQRYHWSANRTKRCMENGDKEESVEIRRNLSEALKRATSLNDISINYNHKRKILRNKSTT